MRKKKQNKINSTLVLIFLGFIWITFNQSGLIKLISLHKEKNQLVNEIFILEKEEKFIKNNIDQLTNNLDYIEFLAYTKYQMVHDDERIYPHQKIYKIQDQKTLMNK
tara:strand:- start:313 stop:633 length:321 start_codon:yes stop_codon:yes gene_type:complete